VKTYPGSTNRCSEESSVAWRLRWLWPTFIRRCDCIRDLTRTTTATI
jgi:hypothetical protein